MAITRAQQARQLYQFGGGADMGGERGSVTGREPGPVGGGQGVRGDTPRGDGPATGAPSQGLIGEIRRQQLEKAPDIVERQKFNPLALLPGYNLFKILGDILPQGGTPVDANRFPGGGDGGQGIAGIPTWMQLGFSSEAEYLASLEDEEDKDKEAEEGLRLAFRANGGRIGLQEGGGIEQRLEQLGGDVTSAEKMLQGINKRLETAESSLGSGGAMQQPIGSGLTQPAGGGLGTFAQPLPAALPRPGPFMGRPLLQPINATLPATLEAVQPLAGPQPAMLEASRPLELPLKVYPWLNQQYLDIILVEVYMMLKKISLL